MTLFWAFVPTNFNKESVFWVVDFFKTKKTVRLSAAKPLVATPNSWPVVPGEGHETLVSEY